MNISVNCKVSLSKKLRALIGHSGSINFIASGLEDGIGEGVLSITGEDIHGECFKGETSIQVEPIGEMKVEVGESDLPCSNLFSSTPSKGNEEKIIRKLAVVNAPEKNEVPHAIKTKEESNTEASIAKTIPSPLCKKWISDMESLMASVNKSKNKLSDVDVTSARTDREKAILMEMKERDEAIDEAAWIVNDKIGNLSVNDLGISLPLNMPYDLSCVSARRISSSRDLKVLVRDGYVRFISPKEKDIYIQKAVGGEDTEGIGELEVYSHHEEAESAIANKSNPVIGNDAIEVTEEDLNKLTEEESGILNLTQNMPAVKQPRPITENSAKPSHTVHGNNTTPLKSSARPISKKF